MKAESKETVGNPSKERSNRGYLSVTVATRSSVEAGSGDAAFRASNSIIVSNMRCSGIGQHSGSSRHPDGGCHLDAHRLERRVED